MVSVKFSVIFWGLLLLIGQFQCGQSLFLGYKKDLLKHKLYKLKEALLSSHDDYDEVHHYHYKPYYVSSGYSKYIPSYSSYGYSKYIPSYSSYGYSKYSPSYASYGYSKYSPSYSSYGWPSYSSGWH